MRKLKGSSNYLKNQVRGNLAKTGLSAIVFAAIFSFLILRILSDLQLELLDEIGIAFLIVPLVTFYYYLRKYHIYNGGWQGEKQVAQILNRTLSDDYFLLNDLYLREGGGDIDHIVLGPNGIFVLETKNWSGSISCNGDEWHRPGIRNFSSNPSRQVKRNAEKIQQILNNSSNLRGLSVGVEGIVVFTNKHASLHVNNPTATVLRLHQLPNHIISKSHFSYLSPKQLESIGGEIVSQKH
jgi:Nuclease-related domain